MTVDIHSTDEEKVEAIKKWLKDNGMWIIVGAAVGFGGVYGYRYMEAEKERHFKTASYTYSQLLKVKGDDAKKAEYDSLAKELTSQFQDTIYNAYARFHIAQNAIDNGKLDQAINEYDSIINAYPKHAMSHIATIRKARVMTQSGQAEQAAALIEKATKGEFAGQYAYTLGDIYMHLGQKDKARIAYSDAMDQGQGTVATDPMLKIKLDSLAVAEIDVEQVVEDAE
jgi:predicted negative regulator of RcsB-dependent stress response